MKKMNGIAVLLAAALLCSCSTKSDKPKITQNSPVPQTVSTDSQDSKQTQQTVKNEEYTPLNYDEQKAVWISYIDLAGMLDDSESAFRENISQAFENVSDLGCNTVYVHVRAFGDAYYVSQYFAPSKYIPAEEGTLRYDPLKIMTGEAHKYGLSFHAWLNPLRCDTQVYMEKMQGTQIYEWYSQPEKYPEYVSKPDNSDYYWLNPAYPEVRKLIADGAAELAENYDIDGVHIDDYFYPTTEKSFDMQAFAAAHTADDLSQWRMDNCSEMVHDIYEAVKSVDKRLLFGVSPQGNMDNNYTQMYADVKKWCSEEGYLDYIAPQIYFGYENSVCPFSETLKNWENIVICKNVKLVCGLGVYKLEREDEFINDIGIIARQIGDTEADENCSGFALYSYQSLFTKTDERFLEEREEISAQLK